MEKKKQGKLVTAIAYILCAAVWGVNQFWGLHNGYSDNVALVLDIICTVSFGICAVAHTCDYVKCKKADQ